MSHRLLNTSKSNWALNRLLAIQEYSLANYAAQAALYSGGDEAEYLATIKEIADCQRRCAADIGCLLVERGIYPETDNFPTRFTGLNNLSARYVALRILEKQPELLKAIAECLSLMDNDSVATALARRVLSREQDNLGRLRRMFEESIEEESHLKLAA